MNKVNKVGKNDENDNNETADEHENNDDNNVLRCRRGQACENILQSRNRERYGAGKEKPHLLYRCKIIFLQSRNRESNVDGQDELKTRRRKQRYRQIAWLIVWLDCGTASACCNSSLLA